MTIHSITLSILVQADVPACIGGGEGGCFKSQLGFINKTCKIHEVNFSLGQNSLFELHVTGVNEKVCHPKTILFL